MIQQFELENLLIKLYETSAWFENKVQIHVQNTRLDKTIQNIDYIIKNRWKDEFEKIINKLGKEFCFSINEGVSFVRIYKMFQHFRSDQIPRKALNDILQGPLIAENETNQTAHARNILFELELAASFYESGIQIIGYDDIEIIHNFTKIQIQCKRPYSQRNVKENLRIAKEQIRKRHNALKKNIIAFSIDKLFKTDSEIQLVNCTQELREIIKHKIYIFVKKHESDWNRIINNNIIGLIISIKCFYIINKTSDHGYYSCSFLFDRQVSNEDSILIKEMNDKISKFALSTIDFT